MNVVRVVRAVAARPRLWLTALRQMRRLAPDRWWRRPPFLPLPAAGYREFRSVTQYGESDHPPSPGDVVDYLAWCHQWDRSTGT